MSLVEPSDSEILHDSHHYFIPHHGVIQGESKLRVVFNASSKDSQKKSLNDKLHKGPSLQNNIVIVLLRWRLLQFVYSADIEKMYRQILIHPDDRKYQQILWRENSDLPISVYQLCTVTYGLAPSAYQALRSIKQLAYDIAFKSPQISKIILENMYVDDILFGGDNEEEAIKNAKEITDALMAGGFPLRKWSSSHSSLLKEIPDDWISKPENSPVKQLFNERKLLGVCWNSSSDHLTFSFELHNNNNNTVTKRNVLSSIAKLYDPMGFLSPLTIRCKIFMQALWQTKSDWDDVLPPNLSSSWNSLYSDFQRVSSISIPRWVGFFSSCQFEIHGFCDASELAMSAVVYLRVIGSHGSTVNLLSAKTKVAPIKSLVIPRLELCSAVLLSKLVHSIIESLQISSNLVHLWSDSKVALSWINSSPNLWLQFVSHRIADIQNLLPDATWHHIEGKNNPADCATRGLTVDQLKGTQLWWNGPEFLSLNNDITISYSNEFDIQSCPEKRPSKFIHHIGIIKEFELIHRFSNLLKLLEVTAWCHRFIKNIRSKKIHGPINRNSSLSLDEINEAELFWIRNAQSSYFKNEYENLRNGLKISNSSQLLNLNPYYDKATGCLRVNGRLKHANLSSDCKNPFIIPSGSEFARLLVRTYHLRSLHGGTQLTLSLLRERYWLIQGRKLIKSCISKCVACLRFRALPATQQMANYPPPRVNPSLPFTHVGVDYAGPIMIRSSSGRGYRATKGYIVVFVCFTTKAIHLEAVTGYDTAHFMASLKRFVSRRGMCAHIYSDCGTNFVGADRALREIFRSSSIRAQEIVNNVNSMGIQWHFNPPAAPHFGGLWEAAVRSVKHHLKRVIGKSTLNFEEMSTLLTMIEACLNSRPLTPMTEDPNDFRIITPGHFLIGRALLSLPEESLLDEKISLLKRWQLVSRMRDEFWKKWHKLYLQSLHARTKWKTVSPNVKVGTMVILINDLLPPSQWSLGRIIEVYPGDDGLVRTVKVKTSSSELSRPISKLVLLPFQKDEISSCHDEAGGNN